VLSADDSFHACRRQLWCPVLKNGYVYPCATSAYLRLFNVHFGASLPTEQGILLNEEGLTGCEILKRLDRPMRLCSFCSPLRKSRVWGSGEPKKEDWLL